MKMTVGYDTSKTLEQLEHDYWGTPNYSSHLVVTCHELRKKPLKLFEIEDLRIMIGQNIGLKYLIPMALDKLSQNILAEGDMYEGDLLTNVLNSDKKYWLENMDQWQRAVELFNKETERLKEYDTTDSIKKEWFDQFDCFATYKQNAC